MILTRRRVLTLAGGIPTSQGLSAFVPTASARQTVSPVPQDDRSTLRRIARVIQEYDDQGDHRTGTDTDYRSARWLAKHAALAGHRATLEPFRLMRVDPGPSYVQAGERRVDGLPMFDGAFTSERGVVGRLGAAGGATEIGLFVANLMAIAAEAAPIEELRRSRKHTGLIVVTRAARPGLCPINARHFTEPFGPPVLQVSSEEEEWLTQAASRQLEITLVVQATRTAAEASNVVAQVNGTDADLPPLVVLTPRSSWWNSAAERGGGLACWLEAMRAVRAGGQTRSILFLATSGHELGHLGLEQFLARRASIGKQAFAWMLFGANIGAAHGAQRMSRLQASDDELERLADEAMTRAGTKVDGKLPRGAVPNGEVRNIHERGGRYLSLGGTNPYFHNPGDRWPLTVDIKAVERYSKAFADLITVLAQRKQLSAGAV